MPIRKIFVEGPLEGSTKDRATCWSVQKCLVDNPSMNGVKPFSLDGLLGSIISRDTARSVISNILPLISNNKT
jgi:hypothetical protein